MKTTFALEDIDRIASQLIKSFNNKIILFNGEMGAGKTTLISALVRSLGGTEEASSPTFSIVNQYEVENDYVYHFDFYRIKNHYEALDIGVEDYFCSGYWNFIEWPDKIKTLLPSDVINVHLTIEPDNCRTIECFESEIF
jgi:tRNA threonylcarbamoyladenosine biosynthesis protein TsaE